MGNAWHTIQTMLSSIKRHKRALVVDDETNWRKLLKMSLEDYGWTVTECDSGKQCLQVLSERKSFDVIFLDYRMPQMNGIQTLKELRKINSEVVVIIISGHIDELTNEDLREFAPVDIVAKPMTWTEIEHIIKLLT